MTETTKTYHIHRFNGQNYQLWKRQMEIYMMENKLKPYILGKIQRPADNFEEWDEKDAQSQAFLMRGLELEQLKYLSDCTTAAQMWSRLRTVHAEKSDQSVQVLLDRFINCRMEDDENVTDYIAKVTSLAQRLKDMDMEQKEPMVIAKIIGSLPSKFDNVRTAWYAVPKADQSIEKITDHLVNEEALLNARTNVSKSESTSEAYNVRTKKYSNSRKSYPNKENKQNREKSERRPGKCNFCGISGHWARECYKKQREGHQRPRNQSFVVQTSEEYTTEAAPNTDNAQLLTVENMKQNNIKTEDAWFADSGATEHMSFRREWFKNFTPFSEKTYLVRVGDGTLIDARGRGDIDVLARNFDGKTIKHTIIDVLYVPKIEKNLISIAKSTKKGIKVIFEEGGKKVVFEKQGQLILDGIKDRNLYKLNLEPVPTAEAKLAIHDSLKIWHERLGHVNFKILKQMRDKKVVEDLHFKSTTEDNPFCEGCIYGKQHRKSFPKSGTKRSTQPGEIFHADLCGKMSVQSIGGANYFMLLKDNYSRYCFIYFLKNKTEVLEKLNQFYIDVQADGHQIRKLRTDGGKEFCNAAVRHFLLSKGIKHETSTPYAPEQNGFIERQNRTVVESAKAMLHARNLPRYLWAEAANTAVYLKNRTASETLGGTTPFEKWYESKPSVKHLRIFGSDCYVHIPKDQRTKWEVNSVKCLMIGYSEGNKSYRVYNPVNNKVMIRRDVIFNENPEPHIVSETVKEKEIEEVVKEQENQVQSANEDESERSTRRSSYRNPRLPILRDPYPKRRCNKFSEDDVSSEQAAIAETFMVNVEPSNVEEAMEAEDSDKWRKAITAELNSLKENNTWVLVARPKDQNVITNRWVFKKKLKANGQIDKYKARLVARGCAQKQGIDYTETFAPVVKFSSVRVILSISAALDLEIYQFDVKTAFLHGELEENIYMEQPSGFKQDDRVCLLQRSLYGLKQASRQWNKRLVDFLINYGFQQSIADPCVFYKMLQTNNRLFLAIYVDDGLLCGDNLSVMVKLLKDLHKEFSITFSEAEFFVGLQISRNRNEGKIKIHQNSYANEILRRFNHENCTPVTTPADPGIKFSNVCQSDKERNYPYRQAIGSLMYLMIATRPDIAYTVGVLSRFMENPNYEHWNGVQRVFKYLKGTTDYGITFDIGSRNTILVAYSDADYAGDIDTRRSTTGWVCFLNSGPVSWSSKKQTVTATSTTEAEFIALCATTKETVWLRRLLADLQCKQIGPTVIYCDNQRAITIVKTPESIKSTKHIEVKFFFTSEKQKEGEIDVNYISTNNQLADTLTKPLSRDKFQGFRICYGIH